MFVKVSDNDARPFYINSDHVRTVVLTEASARFIFAFPNSYDGTLHDDYMSDCLITTRAAAEHFLATVEANSAYEPAAANMKLSAKSRIAAALRHDFPHGATILDLFNFLGDTPTREVGNAIADLQMEKVAMHVSGTKLGDTAKYYHAIHVPKPSPDPSTEAAN